MTFRTRTFLTAVAVAGLALAVSTTLVSMRLRVAMRADLQDGVMRQAVLAGALLSGRPDVPDATGEAHALGERIHARVTFINRGGQVLGDSEVAAADLAALENHNTREEVIEARSSGSGTGMRTSHTTGIETFYAAVVVKDSPVSVIRVALPVTVIEERIHAVQQLALVGFGTAILIALAVAWTTSALLSRRLRGIAAVAARYSRGDLTPPLRDYGDDEIGTVARALDGAVQELGRRLDDTARERAHMTSILGSMFEGVLLINGSGRLVLINAAMRRILRLPDDAEGRQFLEVVRHPDITSAITATLRGEAAAPREVQFDRDPERSFLANIVRVEDAGGGAVLVLHDVTELRRADRIRRDFVANVSHELRTPLTAIRGYVEALIDAPADAPERTRFLDIIQRHTLRMERLVNDLLRLARLDAGQETLTLTSCSVRELVAGVEMEMQAAIEAKRQRVALTMADHADTVSGDPQKLHDVLRNLIENAVNYGPDGSAIEIATTRADGMLVLTVADRGPGIPEVELPRIFERFYRVDRSRTRDPGGTGLGLAIVRHLIELHGGRAAAVNRPGGGTVVKLTLPASGAL